MLETINRIKGIAINVRNVTSTNDIRRVKMQEIMALCDDLKREED